MEDEKETEETPTRGNDWEVVSLTASAYAAAPGPDAFDSPDNENESSKEEDEVSRAMFMSGHFVFPPNQHENLPLEPVGNEIDIEPGSEYASGVDMEGDKLESSVQVGQTYKEKEAVEDVHGIQFFDEKGKNIGRGNEFGEGKAVEGLNLVEEEQTLYTAQKYSSLLDEADITATTVRDEGLVIPTPSVFADQNVDSSSDSSKSLSPTKEKKSKGYNSPCEAWWKRQAASFYAQAKEANAFWSVFVAAALMGIVIIGHRWQQERWHNLQSNIGDEKVNRLMGPLSRFKDVLVGGHRQGSVIRGSASTER